MMTVGYLKALIKDIPDDVFVASNDDLIEFVSLDDSNMEIVHKVAITDNQFIDTSLMRNAALNKDHPWMK